METETRVDGLVDRWEAMRDNGTPLMVGELCADCPELFAEVQRRIEALQAMDSALDTGETHQLPTPGGRDGGAGPDRELPEVLCATAVYRPRRHHDQGGLGVVYTAYQEELDRTVAMKRIRPDKLCDVSRRRFLREAALTARLQHPGIVPIYGLGEADGGPFYTMPFIRGQTLQEAIEAFHGDDSPGRDPGRWRLRFRGLLQQFITVCNTVAYAHDQGVVHRDLKPSNIMLGPYGETLVMDWGLAKRCGGDEAASEDGGDLPSPSPSVDVTGTGEVLGTPQYMSPEQAKGEPAGPAGDIFSLGLVLYAILTGRAAFDAPGPWGADRLKAVREAAIVPPRSRDPHLPRDLKAICLKALAARAEDRYPSARALADDVTSALADEPVTAWREPVSIRARRWGRRHRTAMAAVLVSLVAGLIGLAAVAAVQTRANDRLERANNETTRALERSEESRRQAEAVSTFLVEAFRRPDPWQDSRQVKVAEVFDQASARLDREFAGSPETKAALLDVLGRTYEGLGLYEQAVSLLTMAREVRTAAPGPDDPSTLQTCNNLAVAYLEVGRFDEAIALHQETLERRTARLGPADPDTLKSSSNLANAFKEVGRIPEAIALHLETLERRTARLGPEHRDTLQSRGNLANAYQEAGRTSEAIELEEATLKVREAILGSDHRDTLVNRNNLADSYRIAGRLSEAIALIEGTLDIQEARLGSDHPDTLVSRNNLAAAYQLAGRLSEAIPLYEATLEAREAKLGPDHRLTLSSRGNLAAAYQEAGRTTEAIELHRETLERMVAKLGADHPVTLVTRGNLALAYQEAGRLGLAIPQHEATLERMAAKLGPDHPYTLWNRGVLATAYESLGRWADAEGLFREVLARRRKAVKPDSPLLADDLAALGRNLLAQSRWSEAEPHLHEALAIRDKATPDDWARYEAMSRLGGALLGRGRYAEAEPLVVAGYEGMNARAARIAVPEKFRLREAAERVVRLYEAWDQPEKATLWKTKLGMPDLPDDAFARP